MYFPYFLAYLGVGIAIAVPVFFWALRNNQFKDQQRARYLPLTDEPDTVSSSRRVSPMNRYEGYALVTLALLGLAVSASVLIFAIWSAGR